MDARSDAVRPRRPRAAEPRPLTERQFAEVRRAVLELSGSGARSVKLHGLVVYLDKELTLREANPSTRSAPTTAPQSEGAARAQKPDEDLTSRQRRSRRRLEERIAERQKLRQPQPRGGDEPAATFAAAGGACRAPRKARRRCLPARLRPPRVADRLRRRRRSTRPGPQDSLLCSSSDRAGPVVMELGDVVARAGKAVQERRHRRSCCPPRESSQWVVGAGRWAAATTWSGSCRPTTRSTTREGWRSRCARKNERQGGVFSVSGKHARRACARGARVRGGRRAMRAATAFIILEHRAMMTW